MKMTVIGELKADTITKIIKKQVEQTAELSPMIPLFTQKIERSCSITQSIRCCFRRISKSSPAIINPVVLSTIVKIAPLLFLPTIVSIFQSPKRSFRSTIPERSSSLTLSSLRSSAI